MNMKPEKAAILAITTLILVSALFGYKGHRINLRKLWEAVSQAGSSAINLAIVCAAAGIIIGVLNMTGLAFSLTMLILQASSNSILILAVITALISIVLGMGMPTVGVYILLATLVAPALVTAGVPAISAHLFVFYYGLLSMVTPPVALASFAAANIAGANSVQTSLASIRLAWPAYVVPFLLILSPSFILEGDFLLITWDLSLAVAGIYFITSAIVGYLKKPLMPLERGLFVVGGAMLLLPANLFAGAFYVNLLGWLIFALNFAVSNRRKGALVSE